MTKANDFHLIQAPDGIYFGRLLKSGMLASDSRRITDEEIIAMFENLLRRNKAETGRSVMTVFSKHSPVLMAKLEPDIRECGVLPGPTPEQVMRDIQIQRQHAMMRQIQQARKAKMPPLRVGSFGEPNS